jgi:hypothetical protein
MYRTSSEISSPAAEFWAGCQRTKNNAKGDRTNDEGKNGAAASPKFGSR